jgi:hypothetical protein
MDASCRPMGHGSEGHTRPLQAGVGVHNEGLDMTETQFHCQASPRLVALKRGFVGDSGVILALNLGSTNDNSRGGALGQELRQPRAWAQGAGSCRVQIRCMTTATESFSVWVPLNTPRVGVQS